MQFWKLGTSKELDLEQKLIDLAKAWKSSKNRILTAAILLLNR